jgi:1-acyl-sn-glycerol-3-phosphate acyltransferase
MRDRYMEGNERIRTEPPSKWRSYLEIAAASAPGRLARLAQRGGDLLYGAYATTTNTLLLLGGSAAIALFCRNEQSAHDVARGSLRTACRLTGLTPKVRGALPQGRALLVSNHASNLDALVLTAAFDRNLTFTVKAVAFDDSFFGRALDRLGHLRIDRSTASRRLEGYEVTSDAVRAGRLVHVFPEATITPAAGLRPFRLGAFKLAVELGVPIVPVVIRGTRHVLRDGARMFQRAPIEVDILEPITPQDDGFAEATRLRALVRERIAARLGDDEPDLLIQSAALPPGTELMGTG